MNRFYLFSIFSIFLAFGIGFVAGNQVDSYTAMERASNTQEEKVYDFDYFIRENNGQVVVYLKDRKTVYEYTDVALENFPDYMREELRNGLYVEDKTQLYDFLESYSS